MPAETARLAALWRRLEREHDELLDWLRRGYSLRQAELLLAAPRRTTVERQKKCNTAHPRTG